MKYIHICLCIWPHAFLGCVIMDHRSREVPLKSASLDDACLYWSIFMKPTHFQNFFLGPIGVFLRGTVEKQGKKHDPQIPPNFGELLVVVECHRYTNSWGEKRIRFENEHRIVRMPMHRYRSFRVQRFAKIKSEGRKNQKHHLLTNVHTFPRSKVCQMFC